MGESISSELKSDENDRIVTSPLPFVLNGFEQHTGIDIDEQYGTNAANFRMRFEVYKHAVDGLPVTHEQVLNFLETYLKGDENIVDFGCADRNFGFQIRKQLNHLGPITGVDAEEMASTVD